MNHPPYRLSINKSVDRYLLVELIRFAERLHCITMKKSSYFSLGGPLLIDQKIIHSYFPYAKLISIENDINTYKRQKRHIFCKSIKLIYEDVTQFISEQTFKRPAVFWLDFTRITKSYLDSIANLASKLPLGSIIKVTFNASTPYKPMQFNDKSKSEAEIKSLYESALNQVRSKFNDYINLVKFEQISEPKDYYRLMYNAVLHAIAKLQMEREIPGFFIPCDFVTYSDTSPMMSISGIISSRDRIDEIKTALQQYDFFSPEEPQNISMPDLSNIERYLIDKKLPTVCEDKLFSTLGYGFFPEEQAPFSDTKSLLKSYAKFWHKYPEFVRIMP